MSALSDRDLNRLISKPNGRKALQRILKELDVLIGKCPKENRTPDIEHAHEYMLIAIEAVARLYREKRNAPTNF